MCTFKSKWQQYRVKFVTSPGSYLHLSPKHACRQTTRSSTVARGVSVQQGVPSRTHKAHARSHSCHRVSWGPSGKTLYLMLCTVSTSGIGIGNTLGKELPIKTININERWHTNRVTFHNEQFPSLSCSKWEPSTETKGLSFGEKIE